MATKTLKISKNTLSINTQKGIVVSVKKWSETNINSEGGGGYVTSVGGQITGQINPTKIFSNSSTKTEVWVKDQDSGSDKCLTLKHDIAVLEGHEVEYVEVVFNNTSYITHFMNKNTGTKWHPFDAETIFAAATPLKIVQGIVLKVVLGIFLFVVMSLNMPYETEAKQYYEKSEQLNLRIEHIHQAKGNHLPTPETERLTKEARDEYFKGDDIRGAGKLRELVLFGFFIIWIFFGVLYNRRKFNLTVNNNKRVYLDFLSEQGFNTK